MRSITDLILRMQPYPQQLKDICKANPDFANALKSTHPKKFISLGAVIVSRSPLIPEDEVIGFFVYDYAQSIFKQDFIVNIGTKYKEFVIYTRFNGISKSKYIRDITHFYEKYPTYSRDSHHPSFEMIPDVLKERAIEAINLANKIKSLGLREIISEEEYLRFDTELKKYNL